MIQINGLNGALSQIREFNSVVAMKWKLFAALLMSTIMFVPSQASAAIIFTFGCDGSWHVEGRWADGTVMESRTCVSANADTHDVQVVGEWRTRKGTTAIKSDWDLTDTVAYVEKYTPNNDIVGNRSNFTDIFDTSYIQVKSYWQCSPQTSAINNIYQGKIKNVSANPNGTTNGESSKHHADSYQIDNNYIECS